MKEYQDIEKVEGLLPAVNQVLIDFEKGVIDRNDCLDIVGRYLKNNSAIEAIRTERKRQIQVEEWSLEHDYEHADESLARAAACYAMPDNYRNIRNDMPDDWPWDFEDWKPSDNNRIKELTKAGALIVAEIERIQRQIK